MKTLKWTGLCVGLLTYVAIAHAGVESSGGVETNVFGPVWFKGSRPGQMIKTCTEISPDFGVSKTVADQTLVAAFKMWGEYIVKKDVLSVSRDGTQSIVTTLDLRPACDGSEDLKVYFGVKDALVMNALSKFTTPFGFAQTIGESVNQWSRGFIYVATPTEIAPAPDWTTGNHLFGLLLHEVGHVLGNGHLDGTIMASDLSTYLSYGNRKLPQLENIDVERELRPCQGCGITYLGSVPTQSSSDQAELAFRLLAGRPSIALSAVRMETKHKLNPDGSHGRDYNLPEGNLIFTDAQGEHRFYLKTHSMISSDAIHVPLFGNMYSSGEVFLGQLMGANGTELPVIVNHNSNGVAFGIQLNDGQHYPQRLFTSTWIPYGQRE